MHEPPSFPFSRQPKSSLQGAAQFSLTLHVKIDGRSGVVTIGWKATKMIFPTWGKLPMVKTGVPKWNMAQPPCEGAKEVKASRFGPWLEKKCWGSGSFVGEGTSLPIWAVTPLPTDT